MVNLYFSENLGLRTFLDLSMYHITKGSQELGLFKLIQAAVSLDAYVIGDYTPFLFLPVYSIFFFF